MLYAILCYHDENTVWSWSKEEDAAVMDKIGAVRSRLTAQGKLGASLRLMPTTAATTLRKNQDPPLVIDGPFAETKELVAGYWLWEVKSLDEAVEWIKRSPFREGEVELRPVFEADDFGEALTPELREREERLRARTAERS
jgi:hypothetical protein